LECHLLCRSNCSSKPGLKFMCILNNQTVCKAEQRVVGIELDVRSEAHNEDDDDELEKIGEEFDEEIGDDVA
jgi:hypothetical protein